MTSAKADANRERSTENDPAYRLAAGTRFVVGLGMLFALTTSARADVEPATFLSIGPMTYSSSSYIDRNGQRLSSDGCDFQKSGESIYFQSQIDAYEQVRLSTEYDADRSCSGGTSGFNDVEIDYLHGISGKSHPQLFSLETSVIIPTGYSIETNPRIGLGRPAAELGGLYQGKFHIGPRYGFLISGANVREYSGYPAPQLLTNFTAGIQATPRVLLYESYYGTTHIGAGGTLNSIGLNPVVNAVYDSYNLSENMAYSISRRSALAFTYQKLIGGWNSGIGSTFAANLWTKF